MKISRRFDVALVFAFVTSLLCAVLAHESSLARDALCQSIGICMVSVNEKFWNKLVYDIGMGSLVSLIFYGLLVKLPDHLKRKRISRSLRRQYRVFKEDCIAVILGVVNGSYNSEEVNILIVKSKFRAYFERDPQTNLSKWDDFLNRAEPHNINDILTHLDLLRDEISFVLNNVDIDDDEAFEFMKRIGRVIFSLKDSAADYDSIGPLANFLWSIFTGWSGVNGYQTPDVVDDMIAAI